MVTLKNGVALKNLSPQIVLAIMIANDVWRMYGADLVVTSVNDGVHKSDSFHYKGQACDLRTKNLPEDNKQVAVKLLQKSLGVEYDVLLEGLGTINEHCHVEYDP